MEIDGCKVVDGKRKIKIEITDQDVKKGGLKDPTSCAIARSLCRLNKGAEARVYLSRLYLKLGDKWHRYATPPALRNEIIAFDRGGSFEPGTYNVPVVQPTVRLGAPKRKIYARNGKQPTRGRRSKPHTVKNIRPHGPGPHGMRSGA